jgi:hypothetical protein
MPDGRWLFFVEAGEPAPSELLGQAVHHHGSGSWLPPNTAPSN